MSFADELKKEADAIRKAHEEVVKVVAITAFNSAITSSPVGNPDLWKNSPPPGYVGGAFRSNFYLTFNNPSTEWDPSKVSEYQKTLEHVGGIATSDYKARYILSNNAPYGQRLENGWSSQSPAGNIIQKSVSLAESNISKFTKTAYKKYGVRS